MASTPPSGALSKVRTCWRRSRRRRWTARRPSGAWRLFRRRLSNAGTRREQPRHIRDCKAEPLQVAFGRNAGNRPRISASAVSRAPCRVGYLTEFLARALPVQLHWDDAVNGAGEPTHARILARRHNGAAAAYGTHRLPQHGFMRRIAGAEAEVDQVDSIAGAPFDRLHQGSDLRRERPVEDLHGVNLRIRCLLPDHRSDCGAVSEPVGKIGLFASIRQNRNAARHAVDVRVRRVNAAVDYRDPHAHRAAAGLAKSRANAPPVCCSACGLPASTMRAPSSTSTRSAPIARSSRCEISTVVRPFMMAW